MKKQLEIPESIESTIKEIKERYKELGVEKTDDEIYLQALELGLGRIFTLLYNT